MADIIYTIFLCLFLREKMSVDEFPALILAVLIRAREAWFSRAELSKTSSQSWLQRGL